MIRDEVVGEAMRDHDRWVQTIELPISRIDAAFSDRFWASIQGSTADFLTNATPMGVTNAETGETTGKALVEVNKLRGWVESYESAMYYQGMGFSFAPDARDPTPLSKSRRIKVTAGVNAMVNAYFAAEDEEATASQALTCALLYPGSGGLKMGVDDLSTDPTRRPWLAAVMPWELVFDRRARTKSQHRYRGYTFWISKEEFESCYGREAKADELTTLPTLPHDRGTQKSTDAIDKAHVRVLEFYDLTCTPTECRFYAVKPGSAPGELGGATSVERIHAKSGRKSATKKQYESDGAGADVSEEPGGDAPAPTKEYKSIPLSTWLDGTPVIPLEPLVLGSSPAHPGFNLPPAAALYRISTELNLLISDMATRYRRAMNATLLYLSDKVDGKTLAGVARGDDMSLVGVKGTTLKGLFEWLEQNDINPSVLKYRDQLQGASAEVQLTAGATRGTPGQYLSATEVQGLLSYSQTLFGKMRKRVDFVFCRMAKVYVKFVADEMGPKEKITITTPDGKTVKLTKADLDREWAVTMADGVGNPMAESAKKAEWMQLQGQLMGLLSAAADPESPPEVQIRAKALWDYVVDLHDLPDELLWNNVDDAGEEEAAPPPVAEPPPAEDGSASAPPGDSLDPRLAATPLGQAMINGGA